MPPNERDIEYEVLASAHARSASRARQRALTASRLDEWVRELRVLQGLFRRDMKRQGLSLREAAHRAGMSISSFHYVLDPKRVTNSAKRPKRHMRHATLLQLRQIVWLRRRTKRVLDARIAASARRGSARR